MGNGSVPLGRRLDDELSVLRARAYGTSADIQDDPAAIARLAELEDHAHPGFARDDPAGPLPPGGATALELEPRAVDARTGHSWRALRGPIGFIALGAAVAGLVFAAIASMQSAPEAAPVAVLERSIAVPDEQTTRLAQRARSMFVDETTLRGFDSFRGLTVWSADSLLGNRCLLVLEPSTDNLLGRACMPRSADPSVEIYDVPIYSLHDWHRGLPSGTVARFRLGEDAVTVWVFEGGPRP